MLRRDPGIDRGNGDQLLFCGSPILNRRGSGAALFGPNHLS
jgi:hypothetical protein